MAKKEKTANAKAGQAVELKDKETSFYDPETDFKLVRDQQAKLGDTIGAKTNRALLSGGLLVVGSGRTLGEAKPADDAGPAKKGGKKAEKAEE